MSISSRITEMEEHIRNAYNKIEDLGIDTMNINKNINNISSILETVWNEQPKVLGQGTNIVLKNTRKGKMKLDTNGRTEQEQLTGKNLFDEEIELGSINPANGELQPSTARTRSKNFLKVKPNTTYTISVQTGQFRWIIGYTADKIGITDGNVSGQASAISTFPVSAEKTNTFTTTATTEYIKWYDTSSTDLTEKVQIEEGSTATSYEPYCGGIPSPNPDYPQQIKNVTGNANVKIQNENKNLFNLTIEDFQNGEAMGYGKKVYLTLKPNTYYTLSSNEAEGNVNATNIWFNGNQSDGNGVFINHPRTTSTDENGKLFIAIRTTKITTILENYWIQLEEGSTATTYVEHQEQNYPFTFAEGQRGMQGTQPKDDGINNKHKQRVFDGTENFYVNTNYTTENILCVQITINDVKSATNQCLCSHFKYYSVSNIKNVFRFAGKFLLFTVDRNEYATLEDFKTKFANEYANGTPVIVEYELEEEEIILYNETQQAQYNAIKQARSYDDITIISSESDELGFDMNVVGLEKSVEQMLGGVY